MEYQNKKNNLWNSIKFYIYKISKIKFDEIK